MFAVKPQVRVFVERSIRRYKMDRRVVIVIALLLCVSLTVHFVYFQRPPTEDILDANRRRHASTLRQQHPKQSLQPNMQELTQHEHLLQKPLQQPPQQSQLQGKLQGNENQLQQKQQLLQRRQGLSPFSDKESVHNHIIKEADTDQGEIDIRREQMTTKRTKADVSNSVKMWEDWITLNEFVSIGDIYDKCDGDDRLQVGKVILLEDEENGGMKTRTFVNATFPDGVFGGEIFIKSSYNGRDLYHNQWDLCTVEEDMDDQVIECPLKPGAHNFVKDIKIPNYLPKGTYTSKAWILNENEDLMGCSLNSFTI